MGTMCYAVECFNKKLRYTYSENIANLWAKRYGTKICLAFNIPEYLIEPRENEKNLNSHISQTNQD